MNKHNYLVTITRTWEVEVEAENEDEAKEFAYEDITDTYGSDFDEVDIMDLGEVEADESKIDKEIQDLLHKIEMEDCTEEESLKIIKRIKELRQERRTCKDYLTLVAPILEFLKDESNAKCLKTLANIAGRVNNKAKQLNNRIYFMRTREKDDE